MSTVYYWHEGKVKTSNNFAEMPRDVIGCYCIDAQIKIGSTGRIGQWGPVVWKNLPAEELPKLFRMHLLLMGIPT